MFFRRKFNVASKIGVVAASLGLLLSIFVLVIFINFDNYFTYFDYLMKEETLGLNLSDLISSYMDMDTFRGVFYIAMIVNNGICALVCLACLIFGLISIKDSKLELEAFNKRKAIHILFVVFSAVSALQVESLMGTEIISFASYLSLIIGLALFISFFQALKGLRFIRYETLEKEHRTRSTPSFNDERFQYTKEEPKKDDNPFKQEEVIIGEENLAKPEIKEEKIEVNQQKLDELYSLLSKLEKSYRNGEISEEDYQRMKKTILDNYNH